MAKLPETIEVKATDLDILKECEDCISRVALLEEISLYLSMLSPKDVMYIIKNMPSVQPMRKRGKWINREIYGVTSPLLRGYECSLCGWTGQRIFKYCPMCGAGMFEDSE